MSEDLTKLYNTLLQVETKGASTIILADCLKYLEELIVKAQASEQGDTEGR